MFDAEQHLFLRAGQRAVSRVEQVGVQWLDSRRRPATQSGNQPADRDTPEPRRDLTVRAPGSGALPGGDERVLQDVGDRFGAAAASPQAGADPWRVPREQDQQSGLVTRPMARINSASSASGELLTSLLSRVCRSADHNFATILSQSRRNSSPGFATGHIECGSQPLLGPAPARTVAMVPVSSSPHLRAAASCPSASLFVLVTRKLIGSAISWKPWRLSCRLMPFDARPVISAGASMRVSKAAALAVTDPRVLNHSRSPAPSAS